MIFSLSPSRATPRLHFSPRGARPIKKLNSNGGPSEGADQTNGTVFSSINGAVPISFGTGNGADTDFGPLELTLDGFTGLYNVSVTLSSNNTTAGSPIQRGAVPEPSSALILGFAAFGCICKRHRS